MYIHLQILQLGALPDPELINSLLSIKGDVKGDDADAK